LGKAGNSTRARHERRSYAFMALLVASILAPRLSDAGPAAADVARGKQIYQGVCIACHGANAEGKRELQSPALHQQESWYIVAQLEKFRAGLRGASAADTAGALMRPMALALPDETALRDVTAYIKTLKAPPPKAEIKGNVSAGAAQFATICSSCHGKDARGNPDLKTPALVGQNDWYMVAQLKKLKAGLRGGDVRDITGMQMRGMAMTLATDQAIRDVVAYIASITAGAGAGGSVAAAAPGR